MVNDVYCAADIKDQDTRGCRAYCTLRVKTTIDRRKEKLLQVVFRNVLTLFAKWRSMSGQNVNLSKRTVIDGCYDGCLTKHDEDVEDWSGDGEHARRCV